jgi:DNA-binding response OmpR family regulator
MDKQIVLVVEDEKPFAEAIKRKLEISGFEVVTARTVKQALNYLKDLKIDAVWLDHYLLGKEDGLDLITEMKKEESKWKGIPVFVVSNTATSDKVKAYLHLGAEKYYVKADYRLDKIIEDIKMVLNK